MHKRSSIIIGIILILVGLLLLLVHLFPGLTLNLDVSQQWPLIIVSVGVLLILSSLFGTPTLAIPGTILSGIGGILYVQSLTDSWSSWTYTWALIPGFAGIGLLLAGLLGHQRRTSWREGSKLILLSLVLFVIFGTFFSGLGGLTRFWPLLLIFLGLRMLWPKQRSS